MFFKKGVQIDSNIDTLIGRESNLQGDMQFAGGLRIDGTIVGNVVENTAHPSTLIISESGSVKGAVVASKLILNGAITGPVTSAVFIELQSKARIIGDLHYKSIEMHTGAVIEGKLVYVGSDAMENT